MIFLTPIYLIFALIVIYQLMKRYKGRKKWTVFLLLAFLFYLPLGWDVILGRAYFHYLCHKDGGIHIYETVELGPEYWHEDGSPTFYTEKGVFDGSVFDERYQFTRVHDKNFQTKLNIGRDIHQITDKLNNNVLGERVSYQYWGGWVINTWQPFQSGSLGCHRYYGRVDDDSSISDDRLVVHNKFTKKIFLRKKINEE